MPLFPLKDFYQNYDDQVDTCQGADLVGYTVCTNGEQPIGSIRDVLVDNTGHFRYLVLHISFWGQYKTIIVPIGLTKFNYDQKQVLIEGLNPSKLEALPTYKTCSDVDRTYEQRVRDVFRVTASQRAGRTFLQQPYTVHGQYRGAPSGQTPGSAEDYEHYPMFYGLSDRDNQRPLKNLEKHLTEHLVNQ
jgi:hypothetical protein